MKNKINTFKRIKLSTVSGIRILVCLIVLICIISLSGCSSDTSSDPFAYVDKLFDNSYVHEINISISDEDYQDLLTRALEKNKYIGEVDIDGVSFGDVQLSTKGNSTLIEPVKAQNTHCYSLKLKFEHDDNDGSYYGLDTLHLNNNYTDPSKLRDHISYEMFRALDIPSPLSSYAHVTVNGEEFGLYLAVEGMERAFMERNGLDDSELYKVTGSWREEYIEDVSRKIQAAIDSGTLKEYLEDETNSNAYKNMFVFISEYRERNGLSESDSMYLGADLKYTGKDPDNYVEIFDNSVKKCSDKDKDKVIKALKNLSEMKVDEAVDTAEIIAYFAANNFAINIDGINNMNNYYLAEDDGILRLFPWDYNYALPDAYLSEEAGGMNYHVSIDEVPDALYFADNPMWCWIPSDDKWLDAYHEAMDKLLTEYMESGRCESEVDRINGMLRPYIERDTSNICTLEEYDAAVDDVKSFLSLRSEDVRRELDDME